VTAARIAVCCDVDQRRSVVAAAVVRFDDLVVLWHGGRGGGCVLARADHVKPVGLAVVDERLLHRLAGRPGLVIERAARHHLGAGRRRQLAVAVLELVQLLLRDVVDGAAAPVPVAAERVFDDGQVPVVHFGRLAVGHEAHGHGVQALVGRLRVRLLLLVVRLVRGRRGAVAVKVRVRRQLDDEHLRVGTALAAVRSVFASRLAGQPFAVMVPDAGVSAVDRGARAAAGPHPLHAQPVQKFRVVLFRRLFRRLCRCCRRRRRHCSFLRRVSLRKPLTVVVVCRSLGSLAATGYAYVVFVGHRQSTAAVLFVFLRGRHRN